MPELCEVRCMRDGLREAFPELCILNINVLSGRYAKEKSKSAFSKFYPDYFTIDSHGKYLWFESKFQVIAFTMGMTGKFSLNLKEKYARICFFVVHSDKLLFFNDKRNFGTVKLITKEEHQEKLSQLGPDPLKSPISPEYLLGCFIGKWAKVEISKALMSQRVIAGIGNYLKSEILYRAALSPKRLCGSITYRETLNLITALHHVTLESYACKGVSMRDYALPNGELGTFFSHLQVYKKKHDPLGNEVIKEITADKRVSWWVPEIQL